MEAGGRTRGVLQQLRHRGRHPVHAGERWPGVRRRRRHRVSDGA
jgi:hypothetical protein